jgi:hypothetical protein
MSHDVPHCLITEAIAPMAQSAPMRLYLVWLRINSESHRGLMRYGDGLTFCCKLGQHYSRVTTAGDPVKTVVTSPCYPTVFGVLIWHGINSSATPSIISPLSRVWGIAHQRTIREVTRQFISLGVLTALQFSLYHRLHRLPVSPAALVLTSLGSPGDENSPSTPLSPLPLRNLRAFCYAWNSQPGRCVL